MGSSCNSRLGNFARTSISFVCYDRGIFEYFARQQSCVFGKTFRQSRAGRGHYYVCMTVLTPLFFCQLFLSRLIHSSGGTNFEIFGELLTFCITTPRPDWAV